jgi:hypothetical protein
MAPELSHHIKNPRSRIEATFPDMAAGEPTFHSWLTGTGAGWMTVEYRLMHSVEYTYLILLVLTLVPRENDDGGRNFRSADDKTSQRGHAPIRSQIKAGPWLAYLSPIPAKTLTPPAN